MANLTRDDVLKKAQLGEGFDRADLRGLDLSNAVLEGVDLRRADLEGANLEGAKLRGANLRNASLREAFLQGADLRDVNLDKAELEGANLERAKLSAANLSRANLEGANLTGADLAGARLTNAQLQSANLGGADLAGASLGHADLVEAYLGGAKLERAELRSADLTSANLEEASLAGASLDDAELRNANLRGAKLAGATLTRANLSRARLTGADLSGADLRLSDLTQSALDGATLTGAKAFGVVAVDASVEGLVAEWVDASREGDGSQRASGPAAVSLFSGKPGQAMPAGVRYFGKGDVLRNATLEFGDGVSVQIESRFEQCTIALGKGAELMIGKSGVLTQCQIEGAGNITVHGQFFEKESPGIVGPSQLVVSSEGTLVGVVEQIADSTRFAFEPGCKLRMKIRRPGSGAQGGRRGKGRDRG